MHVIVNDGLSMPGAMIAGKWNINRIVTNCYTDGAKTAQSEDSLLEGSGAFAQYNADGTGRINDKEYDYTFTYSVTDDKVYLTNFNFEGVDESEAGDVPTELAIISLTDTELITRAEVTLPMLGHIYRTELEMRMKKVG